MRDIKYDISQLFKVAFGINSPVFITPAFQKQLPENISFTGLEVLPEYYNNDSRTSWMGTPIVFPVKFKAGTYKNYKTNGEIEDITMDDYWLPSATMFSFRRSKNITRTNVLGNNGTIKEIYGFDDWIIDVKGLCLDEPDKSAEAQLKQLLKWEKIADSIEISGELFNQRNICRVCIADWSDNLIQGKPGVIPFQFQLYGDEPLEFTL